MTPRAARVLTWLAALLTFALTFSLGCWQLRRADQKQAAQDTLVERRALPAWGNAEWPCGDAAAATLPVERTAVLHGRWLADKTVFLDNRPMDGQSGFVIVTPLVLEGRAVCGDAGRTVVLVQRGWLPRNGQDRLNLPPLITPGGVQRVQGRVLAGVQRAYALSPEPQPTPDARGPLVRQNADAAFWRAWLGQSPLAGAVLEVQAAQADEAGLALRRHWPEPGSGRERHLGYAVQWFALAALVAGLFVWFQLIRPRRKARHVPH
jgi:surfeit locus 1 family protein